MSKLITVSEYVRLSKADRPPCSYDDKVVLTVQRDRTFQGEERYVIFCAVSDNQTLRLGAKYPGELLVSK